MAAAAVSLSTLPVATPFSTIAQISVTPFSSASPLVSCSTVSEPAECCGVRDAAAHDAGAEHGHGANHHGLLLSLDGRAGAHSGARGSA